MMPLVVVNFGGNQVLQRFAVCCGCRFIVAVCWPFQLFLVILAFSCPGSSALLRGFQPSFDHFGPFLHSFLSGLRWPLSGHLKAPFK